MTRYILHDYTTQELNEMGNQFNPKITKEYNYNCLALLGQSSREFADDGEHDLVSACTNREEPEVAVNSADLDLCRVAHAPPVLKAGVGDLSSKTTGLQLGHGGQLGDIMTLQIQAWRRGGQEGTH